MGQKSLEVLFTKIADEPIEDISVPEFCDTIQTELNDIGLELTIREIEKILKNEIYNLMFNNKILFVVERSKEHLDPNEMVSLVINYLFYHTQIQPRINLLESYGTQQGECIDEMTSIIEEFDSSIASQESKINDLMPQSITVIGIFVSILAVLLGGFSLISIMSSIVTISLPRLIGILTFTGQVLFNIVFFMMFLLSRISNKPIHTVCPKFTTLKEFEDITTEEKNKQCMRCLHNQFCRSPSKMFRKFPQVVIVNMLLFMIELVLLSGMFVNIVIKHQLITSQIEFFISAIVLPIVGFALLVILIFTNFGYNYYNDYVTLYPSLKRYGKNLLKNKEKFIDMNNAKMKNIILSEFVKFNPKTTCSKEKFIDMNNAKMKGIVLSKFAIFKSKVTQQGQQQQELPDDNIYSVEQVVEEVIEGLIAEEEMKQIKKTRRLRIRAYIVIAALLIVVVVASLMLLYNSIDSVNLLNSLAEELSALT